MSKSLTPKTWVKDVPSYVLQCRDVGHQWVHSTVRRTAAGFERDFICSNCGTPKTQFIDKQGFIVKSTIRYDQEYLSPRGLNMHTREGRALIRLTNLKGDR